MAEVETKPKAKDEDIDSPSLLHSPIQISKTDDEDTLVDVHVNNPLKKITKLLEDIKKQKAFSFTLQGSLGITGIALIVTSFGIFGGTKAFCSRGTQTSIGTFRTLKIAETVTSPVPFLDQIKELLWNEKKETRGRMVIVKSDHSVVHITNLTKDDAKKLQGQTIYVTGEYDACSETIAITDPNAVEIE